MAQKKTIREAIKRTFPTVHLDESLQSAINKMTQNNVSVLAVKIGEEHIGLVTVSDVIFSLSNGDDLNETKISSFMTKCEFDVTDETRNPCIQLDEDEYLMKLEWQQNAKFKKIKNVSTRLEVNKMMDKQTILFTGVTGDINGFYP